MITIGDENLDKNQWKHEYCNEVYNLNGLSIKIINGPDLGTYFVKNNKTKYGPYTKKEIIELTKRLQRHNSNTEMSGNVVSSNADLLHVAWKYVECSVPNCWCGLILPTLPLTWDVDMSEVWIVPAGSIPKEVAKYMVELHNNKLLEKTNTELLVTSCIK